MLVISGFKSKIEDQVTEIFTFLVCKCNFLSKYLNELIFKEGNGKKVKTMSWSKDILPFSSELIFFFASFTNFCLSTKKRITIKATMIKEKNYTIVI